MGVIDGKNGLANTGDAAVGRLLTRRQVLVMMLAGSCAAVVGGVGAADAKYASTYCTQLSLDIAAPVTVTLDANGGTLPADTIAPARWELVNPDEMGVSALATKIVSPLGAYGYLPGGATEDAPTMAGGTFAGWLDPEGNLVGSDTAVSQKCDHTLKASWVLAEPG